MSLSDILSELASFNEVPLPENTPTPPDTTRKREREEDDTTSTFVASPSSFASRSPRDVPLGTQSSASSVLSKGTPLLSVPQQQSPIRATPSSRKQQFPTVSPIQTTQQPNLLSSFDVSNPANPAGMGMQWNPTFNPTGLSSVSGFEPGFESFHLAGNGGGVPGLMPANQALSDAMSPNSFFQELLGSFENHVPSQQDQWGMGMTE